MKSTSVVLFVACAFLSQDAMTAPCAGFTDVQDSSSFCVSVAWMKNRGVTLGCGTGIYCPNEPVTRLQMAAFMNRLGNAVLPPNVVWVAKSGGTFQSIQSAVSSVAGQVSTNNRFLIKVAPGDYNEQVQLLPYIDLEGSGIGMTKIINAGAGPVVQAAAESAIRNLSLISANPVGGGTGIYYLDPGTTTLQNVSIRVHADADSGYGVMLLNNGRVEIQSSSILMSGTAYLNGIYLGVGGASLDMANSKVEAEGASYALGLLHASSSQLRIDSSRLVARSLGAGPTTCTGVFVTGTSNVTITNTLIDPCGSQSSGATFPIGVSASNVSVVDVMGSAILAGSGQAIQHGQAAVIRVAASKVSGTTIGASCFGNFSSSLSAVSC